MTMGKREYTDAEMLRMQRDAEERVREMQARARATVESDNAAGTPNPRNRNWSSNSGRRRPNGQNNYNGHNGNHTRQQQEQPPHEPPAAAAAGEAAREATHAAEAGPEKATTVIGDIMGSLGLDEDYLLIIGLLLILINQRADATLILALAYLLI